MLVFGKNRAKHDKALINVTEIARQLEIKLNDDKLQVAVPRVKYFWHILIPDGTEPEEKRGEVYYLSVKRFSGIHT